MSGWKVSSKLGAIQLAYIVVHIDVMVLRKRMPNASRPFKTPFYPWPQVIGILGMIYAAMHNSPSPELTQKVYITSGLVILFVVVMSTLWLQVIMKKELFKPKSFEHALRGIMGTDNLTATE